MAIDNYANETNSNLVTNSWKDYYKGYYTDEYNNLYSPEGNLIPSLGMANLIRERVGLSPMDKDEYDTAKAHANKGSQRFAVGNGNLESNKSKMDYDEYLRHKRVRQAEMERERATPNSSNAEAMDKISSHRGATNSEYTPEDSSSTEAPKQPAKSSLATSDNSGGKVEDLSDQINSSKNGIDSDGNALPAPAPRSRAKSSGSRNTDLKNQGKTREWYDALANSSYADNKEYEADMQNYRKMKEAETGDSQGKSKEWYEALANSSYANNKEYAADMQAYNKMKSNEIAKNGYYTDSQGVKVYAKAMSDTPKEKKNA